ncbi:MAG: HU family DNA-binding protein [Neisseriaceae bacterium]
MNKSELVSSIAQKAGISRAAAAKALDGFTTTVVEALKKGDTVTLIGFGTYYVGQRAARNGRNPKTGESIRIKASKAPKFRAGKTLKESV